MNRFTLGAALGLAFLIVVSVAQAYVWETEKVNAAGITASPGSLTFDTSGNPHISYSDHTFPHGTTFIYYSWQSGGASGKVWNTDIVYSAPSPAIPLDWPPAITSLALDASENPHVSYYNWTNGHLMYASKSSAGWNSEIVDSAGDVGKSPSLAIDKGGNPHISYYDETNSKLKYAWKIGGGAWNTETVNTEGAATSFTSLALDSSGNPHITYNYYDYKISYLAYASKSSLGWETEIVTPAALSTSRQPSLAFDSGGIPHIASVVLRPPYYPGDNNLVYASRIGGGSWESEIVDLSGEFGGSSSLAFDISGNPHIGYSENGDTLMYASKTGSGAWNTGIVITGVWPWIHERSLAIDPRGYPHIAYGSQWLMHAYPVLPPVADFTTTRMTLYSVQFTDTSRNSPTEWSWDFGEPPGGWTCDCYIIFGCRYRQIKNPPGLSEAQSPLYTYSRGGRYLVSLTTTNAAGSNTAQKEVMVYIPKCTKLVPFIDVPQVKIRPFP